jgi:diacylglycerol kinase (ATP)
VSSPFGPATLVANPRDGRGEVGRRLAEIERVLRALELEHRLITADDAPGVRAAARRAIEEGATFVVAVGEDATVGDVANGMLEADRTLELAPVLGVIGLGPGADFPTTFGLPRDVVGACTHLAGEGVFAIDVGVVSCANGGQPVRRRFVNVADVGLAATAIDRADRLPERLGRGRQFAGFWSSLVRHRPATVHVRAGERAFDGPASDVVVANGQYHRGGMRISPRSWPGDGLLDVLVMRGPRSDAFTLLPKIFRGEHLPHPDIVELKGRTIEVTVDVRDGWLVEADGRVIGRSPAHFELEREAVRLKV